VDKKNTKTPNTFRNALTFLGVPITFLALLLIIGNYIIFVTGISKKIINLQWTFIFFQSTPLLVFSIGFLLYADLRKDLKLTKEKLILLAGFLLFYPVTMFNFSGGGAVPPIFGLSLGITCCLSCSFSEIIMFFLVGIVTLVEFALSCLFGYTLSCFLYKYTRKNYLSWVISLVVFGLLACSSLYMVYYWGDIGGGQHNGNIINLFSELLPIS